MKEIQILMLDIDGVLVTGRPQDGLPWATGLRDDLGVDPGDLHRVFFAPHWEAIVTGRDRLLVRLAEALATIAPTVSPASFIDYWFRNDSRIDTGLLAVIAELRAAGLPVHLATNQEHERAHHLLHGLALADRIDGCHYSADLGCRKPDRAFFDAVTARVGLPTETILLVDDTPRNVEAAVAAGWRAVLWTPGADLAQAIAADA